MRTTLLTGLYCLGAFAALGQFVAQEIRVDSCNLPFQQQPVIDIQQVSIGDTFLIKQIELLIQQQTQQDSLFGLGLGYIVLDVCDVRDNEALRCYYITPKLMSLKEEQLYPPFYTYIGKRLVFIYLPTLPQALCYRYSPKSKRQLRKKLEPFLEKTQDVTAYTMDGKIAFRDKKFRIDYVKFHAGKTIYMYQDKPPKVISGYDEIAPPDSEQK